MKQTIGADTRIVKEYYYYFKRLWDCPEGGSSNPGSDPNSIKYGRKERGHYKGGGGSPKQGLTSAKDLTIELPKERESTYHRLDYLTS